jgi:hypothetical protein
MIFSAKCKRGLSLSLAASLIVVAPAIPLFADDSQALGELQSTKFLLAWGKKGDKPGEFYSPIHIGLTKKDEVFVTDLNNARVQKFTTEGKFLSSFDLPLDKPPRKSCIVGGLAVGTAKSVVKDFLSGQGVRIREAIILAVLSQGAPGLCVRLQHWPPWLLPGC